MFQQWIILRSSLLTVTTISWSVPIYFSSYLKVDANINLRHLVSLGSEKWGVNDHIDLSRLYIKGVLIKVTNGDKEEVLELDGLFGVAGTGFLPAIHSSHQVRRAYLSMKHLAARCFKRPDRYPPTIFGNEEAPNITFELGLCYDDQQGVVETTIHSAMSSVKSATVKVIGYILDIEHKSTDLNLI
ncbi:hypothetical protein OBP_160 [Pseudomonas phage OBP]|uniref:hypothetical protein n=1 Tax=Pseudomonas phage OBP TaxID=1124849 RepID=UPI000240D580|nr:hypothetical protein OBP_160 [Pseudomonas phage OBP]AEV89597.1 hypothetical protein OBP_160 [Pseudomonas phage OBP]